jgi:hypothetical protein
MLPLVNIAHSEILQMIRPLGLFAVAKDDLVSPNH